MGWGVCPIMCYDVTYSTAQTQRRTRSSTRDSESVNNSLTKGVPLVLHVSIRTSDQGANSCT